MCACIDITPQSEKCYAQMLTVEIPPHMDDYRKARNKAGLSGLVSIDPCVMDEIKKLWNLGIHTYGSCCGHNKHESFVNVHAKDVDLMISLGYAMNHPDKTRRDTFRLQSV